MAVEDHYIQLREIPNQGLCGLGPLITTIGLFCKLQADGYKYRYCYANLREAIDAIVEWDGTGHPSGPWIVRKGAGGDLRNPKHPDYNPEFDS